MFAHSTRTKRRRTPRRTFATALTGPTSEPEYSLPGLHGGGIQCVLPNDFLWPLIILTDQSNYTLPVALAALSREHVQDIEMMMAGAVITVAPVLILFLALQRYYIRGMLAGSVKG